MQTQDKLNLIRERLTAAFTPKSLEVLDESHQHIGHAGHKGGGRHFAIIISAPCFVDMSRVNAHRKIYDLFTDLIPEDIHALKIKIL